MKYWRIVWKNVTRNRKRTTFTILSIAFSIMLVTFLRTLIVELSKANPAPESVRRAVVRRATSLGENMPESYRRKLQQVPEVELVTAMDWFGGVYQEPRNFFANFAVDHETLFRMFPEIELDENGRQAFFAQRSAAICGVKLARRFGWKVGDRITLMGSIYPVDLEFTLVGIYQSMADTNAFYFRRDYFEEAMGKPGRVGAFFLLCSSQEAVPGVIANVDSMFRNTDAETLTETERSFEAGFQSMLGNIRGLVLSISSVVIFMILLIVGNTMAMSVREQSHEIAILKSLGFQNESLFGMLVGEALVISLLGGLAGTLATWLVFNLVDFSDVTMGLIREFKVELPAIALGMAVSLAVGLVSGGIPALHVSRLTVSEGLRRVG
jgi:putative ABC transport system permease protein